jgi:hypothetical protein
MRDPVITLHNFVCLYDLEFVELRLLQGRDWMDSNFWLIEIRAKAKTGAGQSWQAEACAAVSLRVHWGLGGGGSDVVPVAAASPSDFGFPMDATLSTLNFL